MALIPIIEGAGGIVTTWDGGSAAEGGAIVACGDQRLHAAGARGFWLTAAAASSATPGLLGERRIEPGMKASKAAQNALADRVASPSDLVAGARDDDAP